MSTKPPKVSEKDSALFRHAMRGVKPLKQKNIADISSPKPKLPIKRLISEDELDNPIDTGENSISPGQTLEFYRPGLQHQLIRKLRQGHFPIQAKLDLHGKTIPVARKSLTLFIHRCIKYGVRVAIVVHGKGKGSSEHQPILKNQVNHWLTQYDNVLGFCSAKPKDGGTGAVYVLLKKS